ncbi:hypothetical protein [Arsenicicoccus dermatophilus]|uniref:hypothetical protein n=1 Tax=Arsenicicoccus dermatophilus TaxID=1076331 RepID=UPI0039170D22
MIYQLESWGRTVLPCPCPLADRRVLYTGRITEDRETCAVYWLFLYDHDGYREVFVEIAMGSFEEGYADHVTFAARTGRVAPRPGSPIGSTFVDSQAAASPLPLNGEFLSPAQARHHQWADTFWALDDHLLTIFPEVGAHLAGEPSMGDEYPHEAGDFVVDLPDLTPA